MCRLRRLAGASRVSGRGGDGDEVRENDRLKEFYSGDQITLLKQ